MDHILSHTLTDFFNVYFTVILQRTFRFFEVGFLRFYVKNVMCLKFGSAFPLNYKLIWEKKGDGIA